MRVQYAAFKEGYSFNTLLKGSDLRDSLRVKRSGNVIKVAGGKTTAVVGMNGSKVCMVRFRPPVTLAQQLLVDLACLWGKNAVFPDLGKVFLG